MAGESDIIREFLVSLGFKIDTNSLNKFDKALGKSTKTAVEFAGVMIGMATAATVMVDKVATKMEGLYWSSVRLRDGADNIQDFQLALSKVGGSGEEALASLENMATYLRTNPAGEGLLKNIGVQTRDAAGNLRSTIALVRDFAHLPMPYWLKVRFAQRFGIDERTLQAIIRAAPEAENRLSSLYKRAGIDANKAAEDSKDFKNELRDLDGEFGVVTVIMESRLLPAVRFFVGLIDKAIGLLIDLDKATGGWSTNLISITALVWGLNTALAVTFGGSLLASIGTLIARLGLLAVTVLPAVGEALFAIGTAIMATPVGWIAAAIGLLAASAILVITHWDKVKQYFNGFVGWLREKYNAVAKYLGLPQWTSGPSAGAPGQEAPQGGAGRDFRQEERNLGPQSQHGSQGEDASRAMAFFEKAGWTAAQSAGIVANLVHESGLNAHATGDHGAAYGVAQWHKDRQDAFKAWAGKDIRESSLAEQLAFVNHELKEQGETRAGAILGAAQTAAAAGAAVSRFYERPAGGDAEALGRAKTATSLVNNARLTGGGGSGAQKIEVNQKTDIQVSGSGDPSKTAKAVGREVDRANGNLVRNFAGAVS